MQRIGKDAGILQRIRAKTPQTEASAGINTYEEEIRELNWARDTCRAAWFGQRSLAQVAPEGAVRQHLLLNEVGALVQKGNA